MKSDESKRFIKKYTIPSRIIHALLGISAIAFILLQPILEYNYSLISLCIIALIISLSINTFFYSIKLRKIISNELNPQKYKEVIDTKFIVSYSLEHDLFCSHYAGEYQKVIDICTYRLKKRKNSWPYYAYLAGAYFQLEDIDSLRSICDKFDEATRAKKGNIQARAPLMKYYSLYAKGEHEALKELYDIPEKTNYSKAGLMLFEYIHAINFYTLGDVAKAKEIFEKIKCDAPLLGIGKLSESKLEAINQGKDFEINPIKLNPTEAFLPTKSQRNVDRLKLIRKISSFILIIVFAIGFSLIGFLEKKSEEYEQRLYDAIDVYYDDFEILDHFNIKKDGELVEAACIFQQSNGTFAVGYFVKYPDIGEVISIGHDEIVIGKSYYDFSPCTDYIICYEFFENKNDIPPENHFVSKLNANGKTIYFCILEIL